MHCPKCQFDHEAQTTECLKCGIVFAKYQRAHAALPTLPLPIEATPGAPGTLQEARAELTYRLLALPVALLVARLLVGSPLAPLVRIFVSMWVHETGHAVTAWLCGFGAFPGPWFTPVSSGRLPVVTVALAVGVGWGLLQAWRAQDWSRVAGGTTLLLLQLVGTGLPAVRAQALIIFGGDAGCLVLGSLVMATFYAPRESPLYRGALRWGCLGLGAAAFMDAFETWWGARHDLERIPFGENEGVGLSDPSLLLDAYGWTTQAMIRRYVWLGMACLGALALLYVVGALGARTAVRKCQARGVYPRSPVVPPHLPATRVQKGRVARAI